MLTVVTGRSRRLWPRVVQEIGEALASGGERLLCITPDQYTLQAELELIDLLHLPGLLQVEVLSPSRLLSRVFSLAGSPRRVRVDGRGKAMMLADVLRTSKKDLSHYGGAMNRRGFAERLSADIGNLKRAGMGPMDVLALSETLPSGDALRGKLADVAFLYGCYEQRLEGAFLDSEDAQEALLSRLPESGLLSGARVWIYGFDLIPPQFARQIAVMARGADSVRLFLTLENASSRDGLAFAPARDTLARLARFLDAEALPWQREHVRAPLSTTPAIAHLEEELFAIPQNPYAQKPESVTLWAAANPYDEAMRTAAAMLAYARAGMRFDEMAVVTGDVEAYAGAIDHAFSKSGIPFHIDRNRPALSHPLLRAVLSALRCVTRGWQADDALTWLKGGFSTLSRDEAERLENFSIEHGLRGAKWRASISDIEMETLRARFLAPLSTLQARLREAKDATETLSAIYLLLEDTNAYQTLESWQRELAERNLHTEAADCAQAWRLLLETLDQLHSLLGGRRLPMGGVAQVMEAGLSAAELGAIPATPGVTQVGQLGHVKLGSRCRALFLLGMQDGVMHASETSLLSSAEASRAAEALGSDAAFGLRGDALLNLMQINLLDTLAAPSERLFISHSLAGANGEAQRPAAVLRLLRRVFPQMEARGGSATPPAVWHAPRAALDSLGPMLRRAAGRGSPTDQETEIAAWLLSSPETGAEARRILDALTAKPPKPKLSTIQARALYSHTRTSVSRLEAFANCPFKHFIQYGLRPKPRREFTVARDETGSFYHRAIEEYARIAAENPAWPHLTRENSDALMDQILAPLRADWENRPLSDNAMLRSLGDAFCRVARRAAWTYADQTRRGGFRTGVVEARFGPGEALPPIALRLADGRSVLVEGRIDRIDFYEEDGEKWLRVVDYKSGGTTLDPSKLYAGLQLQLLLYLSAALSAYPGIAPAGAFYSRFDDPLVETDQRDVERIEAMLSKELRLRGIALSDVRVAKAMDGGAEYLKKDGGLRKSSELYAPEELSSLMTHAAAMAGQVAGRIAEGEIHPHPAQLTKWRACQWCDFRDVCAFDPATGAKPGRVEKLTKEEMLQRIAGERK